MGTTDHLAVHPYTEADAVDWLYSHEPHSAESFVLRNVGAAMVSHTSPSFPEGCTIVFDPKVTPINGDCVLARLVDSQITVFRQYIDDAGTIALIPFNSQYKRIDSGFEIIAVAIEKREALRG